MKIRIQYIIILSALVSFSCSKKPEYIKVVGNWKVYDADFDSTKLDKAFIDKARKSVESSSYGFQADKHFQISDLSFSGGSYRGIWSYSEDKKTLTLFYPDFNIDPEVYEVIKLNRRTMIIRLRNTYGYYEYKMKKIKD